LPWVNGVIYRLCVNKCSRCYILKDLGIIIVFVVLRSEKNHIGNVITTKTKQA
jgi:hypothetical protein